VVRANISGAWGTVNPSGLVVKTLDGVRERLIPEEESVIQLHFIESVALKRKLATYIPVAYRKRG